MRQVFVAPQAAKWFSRRIVEIAHVNPLAAHKLIFRFEEIQRLIAEFPEITERGRRKGTRKITMPPFVLMSRRIGDDIEIYAIRHARQRDALAPRRTIDPTEN